MGKRLEKIYDYITKKASLSPANDFVTTNEISEQLNIQRSNVSKDLNQLVRENKLTKTTTRPVKYRLANEKYQSHEPLSKYVASYKEERKPRAKQQPLRVNPPNGIQDIFDRLIGSKGSMKNATEQAKAAILYPPKGLNCLITGPTGSGKTFFAHAMFQFAKVNHIIASNKELIVFNCADYANNAELLMSHLFGYAKGAFTGAEKEKRGIIDQADGSMLFLDEIHRLPPEGQEMVFYFMDHGTYSRLGESGKQHQADVRIIGATTEDPHSALLDTFVRRIPINIHLPSFEERPATEQIDLVRIMFSHEANRIKRAISVTEDVVKALIGSVNFGNIGQLKSNVQMVCARGFLNHMQEEQINLTIEDVPEGIRSGLFLLASKRKLLTDLSKNLESKILIQPDKDMLSIQADAYELPYNLYDIIGDKAALLKADGVGQEDINQFISTDINIHLKSFYKDHGFSFDQNNKLSEFVDEKVIKLTSEIKKLAQDRLDCDYPENFIYAMSLHISSLLKKIQVGEKRSVNVNIQEMIIDYPTEFEVAHEIRQKIGQTFRMTIPENEDYYLAALLVSLENNRSEGKIGIVVAAHGTSTASSMVSVVRQLLGIEQMVAVDMPLDMSPKAALEKMKQAVLKVHEGRGVLLLVDMGSLVTFNDEIKRQTTINVATVDMVSTPMVLEAARKASVFGTTLENLYDSLKSFHGYSELKTIHNSTVDAYRPQAILAICASGEGTAKHLQSMIQVALEEKNAACVQVITLSSVELSDQIEQIKKHYQVIATTGVIDPQMDVPFISLEKFFTQEIDEWIDQLLLGENLVEEEPSFLEAEKVKKICLEYLEKNFTFLNPYKLIEPLIQFSEAIMHTWNISFEKQGFKINFLLHTAGMLERIVLQQPLSGTLEQEEELKKDPFYEKLHVHVQSLGRTMNLSIPSLEIYYLLLLIKKEVGID